MNILISGTFRVLLSSLKPRSLVKGFNRPLDSTSLTKLLTYLAGWLLFHYFG